MVGLDLEVETAVEGEEDLVFAVEGEEDLVLVARVEVDDIFDEEAVVVDVVDVEAFDEIFVEVGAEVDEAAAAGDEDTAAWGPPTPGAFEQELPVHFW